MEEKKNVKKTLEDYAPILDLLLSKQQRLEIILSLKETDKPLIYSIKGKKSTKTVFIADSLKALIVDYCNDRQIKQGDLIEAALVDFLINHGYEQYVQAILNNV